MIPIEYQQPTATEDIGGLTYTSAKLPALRGIELLGRTIKVLGPQGLKALVAYKAGVFKERAPWLVKAVGTPSFFSAIVQVAHGSHEDRKLAFDLCQGLHVDKLLPSRASGGSVQAHFDAHFSGEYLHLGSVLAFAIAHNFAGFTLGIPSPSGIPTSVPTAKENPSDSQNPSEGSTTPESTA